MATSISSDRCIRALSEISAYPTAAFYEARVARYILGELQRLGLPVERDSYGNIIATYAGPGAPDSGGMALVAHMDHPAFELLEVTGKRARARLLGGVNQQCFSRPVPVRIFPAIASASGAQEEGLPGQVIGYEVPTDGSRLLLDMELETELSGFEPGSYFGIWGLPQIEVREGLAYMRAVDDLAGCAAILLTLEQLVERQVQSLCYGVFTRAEEVGLLGATLLASAEMLPKDTVIVSLETSKTLPGAEIGAGPVIRVGDRVQTFDGKAEAALHAAWSSMQRENPDVKVQRQLMSGGTCEATIFYLTGYPTTAMALPLGNYHNVSPVFTIDPEYISVNDLATEVELLTRATQYVHTNPSSGVRKILQKRANDAAARLQASFEAW